MAQYQKRKKGRAGGKLTGSSVTVIEAAGPIVDLLQKLPAVSKISIGHIVPARSRLIRLRFQDQPAALFIYVHGNCHIQLIRAFTGQHRLVQEQVQEAFAGSNRASARP